VCVFELVPDAREVQVLPAGRFRATDGRPHDAPSWYLDAALAARVIEQIEARANDIVIDYEHQTLNAATNGQAAPAAGWAKKFEWREGQGLYATDANWTDKAKAHIAAREYRYISPVFEYDKKTGAVRRLLMLAITNYPALDGMDGLIARAAARFQTGGVAMKADMNEARKWLKAAIDLHKQHMEGKAPTTGPEGEKSQQKMMDQMMRAYDALGGESMAAMSATLTDEEISMNELLKKLLKQLGLKDDATEEAALSAVASLLTKKTELETAVAAAKAQAPDPEKYVPVETVKSLQTQIASLTTKINEGEVDGIVKKALDEGRLLPAMEDWARELGKKDVAALKTYIDAAQPIAALKGTQSGGNKPERKEGDLSDEEIAVCRSMGLSEEEFKKNRPAAATA